MAGMQGFAEKGAPEGWDMALGTVRGFRWWQMHVPLIRRSALLGPRGYGGNPSLGMLSPDSFRGRYVNMYTSMEFGRDDSAWNVIRAFAKIQGMHCGEWRRQYADVNGRYRAACTPHSFLSFTPHSFLSFTPGTGVPYTHLSAVPDPECSCGFWAYWDGLPVSDFDCSLPALRFSKSLGYALTLPVGGVIEGSGHTIIGEKGFRCEYAKITDLAVGLAGPGVFYDQDAIWRTQNYYFGAGAQEINPHPHAEREFLPFLHQKTGIPPAVLTAEVKTAVTTLLGSDFRWHHGLQELLRDALRDENYASKLEVHPEPEA